MKIQTPDQNTVAYLLLKSENPVWFGANYKNRTLETKTQQPQINMGSKINQTIKALCATGALLATVGAARADISGKLWEGDATGDASIVPGGTPDVTFSAPGVNFASGGAYTIGEFLASGGSSILTGAGELGNSMFDTHIELTGSVFLNAGNNSFNIDHDDGTTISITGIGNVLNVPGPTAPVVTPFNINAPAAGLYDFTLEYNECCGAPAVLSWTFPTGAPVGAPDAGSTAMFLGGALALLGTLGRRFRK